VLLRRTAAFAIAATLLVGAILGWLKLRPREEAVVENPVVKKPVGHAEQLPTPAPRKSGPTSDRGPVVASNPQPTIKSQHEPRHPAGVQTPLVDRTKENISRLPAESEVVAWRPPNALEELMLAARDRERRSASPSSAIARRSPNSKSASGPPVHLAGVARGKSAAAKPLSPEQARVAAAIQRLVSEKRADVAAVSLGLRKSTAISEQLLIETLERGKIPEQIAAVRLLAEIGGPLSMAPLLRAARESSVHSAALEALARLADPSVLGELAQSEQSPELQRSLLATLLARREPASLDVFLCFVENDPTAETALAAAQTLKDPPMDLLFASLSAPLESRRIAAARVIGRIDGAATTQRLIGMVESGVNRHEACIALLSSRGPEAMRYVDAARRDPALGAIFSGARLFTVWENPPRS
jgi:HEAT repeat protein